MFRTLATSLALLALFVGVANAQFSGAVEGYVNDATGAVIPGAEVSVIDENLGVERKITSNESGFFRIAELSAGSYQVSVTSEGFQTWSTTGLLVRSSETRTLYPELAVGEITTSVTVEADTSAVNTTEVDNSNYIAQEAIRNQPLPRNTIWQLATLVPGVTGSGATRSDGGFVDNYEGVMGLRVNASGQRQEANVVMMNGSYAEVPSWGGTFMVSPIPDSLQEFRVEAQSFSAAKGRSSGAVMELVTKSGTNEWHGTVGFLYSNDNLSARTIRQSSLIDSTHKDFWATMGGPIKKNKTFVFGVFDILRSDAASNQLGTAETEQFRNYVSTNFPQSLAAEIFSRVPATAPTADIISVGQLKLRHPGQFDDLSTIPDDLPAQGTVNANGSAPRGGEQYQFRVDHHLSDKDRLFGYFYNSDGFFSIPRLIRPSKTTTTVNNNYWWKVNWNHVFSPTFLNSMGYRRSRQTGAGHHDFGASHRTVDIPNIGIAGVESIGAWGPGGWTTPTWEWQDMATLNKGAHTMQIGVDYVRPDDGTPWRKTSTRPGFSFGNLLDFAQDKPTSQGGPTINIFTGQVGGAYLEYYTAFTGIFLQDNWRLRPGFSLNIGVRVDNYGEGIRHTERSDPGCYLFAGQGSNTMERIANGFAECRQTMPGQMPWLVSPRFGFAWDVFKNGSISIRGGYGMYRDRIPQNWFATLSHLGPPAMASPRLTIFRGDTLTYGLGNWGDPHPLAQDIAPDIWPKPDVSYEINERGGVEGLRSGIKSIDQNIKIPTAHSWMLSIQKRIGSDAMAEINYTGSADHNLTANTNINRFPGDLLDGRLDHLNPFFANIDRFWTGANSNAHLLSLLFQKRHTSGRSIRFVYTYAKVLDQYSTSTHVAAGVPSTNVFDVWNLRAQRGPADFDTRQRLTFDGMWQARVPEGNWYSRVVNGWRLGTLGILQTGLPYTVYTSASFPSGDFNADGNRYDRPNAPAFGNSLSGSSKSDFLSGLFTPADFPIPAPGQQGNLGRNTFTNPGLFNINLLITREFKIPWRGEGAVLQVRGEIFNVINRVNLNEVRSNMAAGLFGRATDSYGPRSSQLGLRFVF